MTHTRQLPISKHQQDQKPASPHKDVESKHSPIIDSLHGVSDVVAIAHSAGAHLSHTTHLVGAIAGGIAETLQNPSSKLEDIVCNTGTKLLKDVIDTSVTGTIMAPIRGLGRSGTENRLKQALANFHWFLPGICLHIIKNYI